LGAAINCGGAGPTDSLLPASLLKLFGDNQVALPGSLLPESLVVEVRDQKGNGVGAIPVVWQVTGGGGTIAAANSTSDATGRVAAAWTIGSAGSNTVGATAAGFSVTFSATGSTVLPARLSIQTPPSAGQSGVDLPTQPVIQLLNGNGTPLSQAGVNVSAAISSGSAFATLGGTLTMVTASNGRATFTDLNITGPVGNYTLRFSATGFTQVSSTAISLSTVSGRVPLIDMGSRTYFGFDGGLYQSGSNTIPAGHAAAGSAKAHIITPLDTNGSPSPTGKVVLLSIGISNASQEWCDVLSFPCNAWTFTGQEAQDPAVNQTSMVVVNGAQGGSTAQFWDSPTDPEYDRVRDNVLPHFSLTEAQVQVVWLKTFNADPTVSLPSSQADAIALVTQYGNILRALKVRYPHLQQVFMSSRIYGGYATSGQNPEPYAYETGFAVKWVIQAQIDQMTNGGTVVDNRAGDLNYNTVAPWVAWGPYLWADGLNPRSDGLTWSLADLESDGTHPSTSGETKVGTRLLTFFKTDPRSACWFLAGRSCP
ncbi:MAG: hypothetical protein ABI679_12830, partial [Gemmatimonadota bacterium]